MPAQILKFERREKPAAETPARPPSQRFEALDVLRGLCVIGMLLANNAGDWGHIYTQLDHAEWHGFTLTDMVFPGFLVCVGLSMAMSLGKPLGAGGKAAIGWHAARRAAILVALGLFLNALPNFDLVHLRLPGVLQRISICYGLVTALVLLHSHVGADGRLNIHVRPLIIWAAGLLIGYAAVLKFVPVPGFGANRFDSIGSWPAYVDRMVFGLNHMWEYGTTGGKVTYDPEGILSTFPAMFNILAGLLAGLSLRTQSAKSPVSGLAMAAFFLIIVGLGLDAQIPIAKKLWTSSFALLSSGFALLVLSLLILVVDRLGFRSWTAPVKVFGSNAILAYTGSWIIAVLIALPVIHYSWGMGGVQGLLSGWLQGVIGDPYAASFAFAACMVVLFGLLLTPFYLKRWFLKV